MMTSHNRTRPSTSRKLTKRVSLISTVVALGCASGASLPEDTGITGTGGAASGGAFTSTGGSATGGTDTTASGGAFGAGGALTATGGDGAGGMTATGGGDGAGGMTAAGGGDGAGGMGSGGEPTVMEPCVVPTEEVCGMDSIISVHCGLTYELWANNGSACMTNTADGFLAEWNGNNYIARVGLRPGDGETLIPPVVTYTASYSPNGTSYLTVYGWTTDPLVEFYILEAHDPAYRPPGNGPDVTSYSDIQVDGGTYQVRRSQRVDQPSIIGTASFPQYWSLRKQGRTSGSIDVAAHFAAWERAGLQMGDIYEVSMAVEGFGSRGTAEVQVSFE